MFPRSYSRSRDCGLEPHRRHCVVTLSNTLICLALVQRQHRKTHSDMTEKMLNKYSDPVLGPKSKQTKKVDTQCPTLGCFDFGTFVSA